MQAQAKITALLFRPSSVLKHIRSINANCDCPHKVWTVCFNSADIHQTFNGLVMPVIHILCSMSASPICCASLAAVVHTCSVCCVCCRQIFALLQSCPGLHNIFYRLKDFGKDPCKNHTIIILICLLMKREQ